MLDRLVSWEKSELSITRRACCCSRAAPARVKAAAQQRTTEQQLTCNAPGSRAVQARHRKPRGGDWDPLFRVTSVHNNQHIRRQTHAEPQQSQKRDAGHAEESCRRVAPKSQQESMTTASAERMVPPCSPAVLHGAGGAGGAGSGSRSSFKISASSDRSAGACPSCKGRCAGARAVNSRRLLRAWRVGGALRMVPTADDDA